MIKREYFSTRKDGVKLYRSYSNSNLYIQKKDTDEIYSDAIDVENVMFEYIETEKEIEDLIPEIIEYNE